MQGLHAQSPMARSTVDPRLAYALPGRVPGASAQREQSAALIPRHESPPADAPLAYTRSRAERRSEVLQQLAAGRRLRSSRGLR
jgi:hypothetical protein